MENQQEQAGSSLRSAIAGGLGTAGHISILYSFIKEAHNQEQAIFYLVYCLIDVISGYFLLGKKPNYEQIPTAVAGQRSIGSIIRYVKQIKYRRIIMKFLFLVMKVGSVYVSWTISIECFYLVSGIFIMTLLFGIIEHFCVEKSKYKRAIQRIGGPVLPARPARNENVEKEDVELSCNDREF